MVITVGLPQRRLKRRVGLEVIAVAALLATAACGSSSSTKASSSAAPAGDSVVAAPVQTAHTTLGNVAYRAVGSGQPLVLVMGYGGTMETWDPRFVDTLAHHYRVVVFDNAGLGGTQSLPAPLTIDAMADQTAALISSLGLTAPYVFGWSMGTMIAQSLAVRHPTDVGKLVLAASWPGNGTATVPPQTAIDALKSGNPDDVRGVMFPADQVFSYDAYIAGVSTYPSAASASASTISSQDNAITSWWAGSDAAGRNPSGISAPTLIMDGNADQLDAASNSEALAKLIPKATVQLYPDAGHAFLFQEGAPLTFLVESFLNGPPAPVATSIVTSDLASREASVSAAGRTFDAGVKALPTDPTSAEVTAIDEPYATTISDFDDQLLNLGTSGSVGDAVNAFVAANEKLVTDVLALALQSKPEVASWSARAAADGQAGQAAGAALRNALGLPPASGSP